MPAATGMMGSMMGQSVPVMGQSVVGMGMPNGFTGATQTGVMGLPQNVVGPQGGMVGQMVTPQNKYGLQQNPPAQWNLSQVKTPCAQAGGLWSRSCCSGAQNVGLPEGGAVQPADGLLRGTWEKQLSHSN